jgi:hypothetical protein
MDTVESCRHKVSLYFLVTAVPDTPQPKERVSASRLAGHSQALEVCVHARCGFADKPRVLFRLVPFGRISHG